MDISVLLGDSGQEIERGGQYLEMSELTPMDSPFVSGEAAANRADITGIMAKHGFAAYPFEFWHYSGGDAYFEHINRTGRPARYGPVKMNAGGRVSPLDDPCREIFPAELIEKTVEKLFGGGKERF